MSQEMTSFVLRFVREVSEEQGARWRGLIQHVQSGAERNFSTFADAVQFMQGRVVENTIQTLEKGEQVAHDNLFAGMVGEMTKMWGNVAPQMAEMWTQAAEKALAQSMTFRSQVDQAVATTLKAWGLPTGADQDAALLNLTQLNDQLATLTARVEALEKQIAAQQAAPKRRSSGKRAKTENTDSAV